MSWSVCLISGDRMIWIDGRSRATLPISPAAEVIPGAIGLSGSTVSRGFIEASAVKLRELQERDLSGEDVVAVVLDGKTFADVTMVIALGITMSGEKRVLGFVETDTENAGC